VATNAYSAEGIQLSKSFGLQYRLDHNYKGKVYTGGFANILERYRMRLDARFPNVLKMYRRTGLYNL
jgi:hypothetical protein